jgi:hypothetical protein
MREEGLLPGAVLPARRGHAAALRNAWMKGPKKIALSAPRRPKDSRNIAETAKPTRNGSRGLSEGRNNHWNRNER